MLKSKYFTIEGMADLVKAAIHGELPNDAHYLTNFPEGGVAEQKFLVDTLMSSIEIEKPKF
jgi:hypothetical protein